MSGRFAKISGVVKWVIICEFILAAYLLYSLTRYVYSGYRLDQYIEDFRVKNEQLQMENQTRLEDLSYFSSDEYIDKIAKQNFGKINPGEKVIIVSDDSVLTNTSSFEEEEDGIDKNAEMSNPAQWWDFFFG